MMFVDQSFLGGLEIPVAGLPSYQHQPEGQTHPKTPSIPKPSLRGNTAVEPNFWSPVEPKPVPLSTAMARQGST